MEPGEREKRGSEEIQTDAYTALVETPVFQSLPDNENASEQDRRGEPCFHFPWFVSVQTRFRSPDGTTARKQTDAEDAGLQHVQLLCPRSSARRRVIEKKRDD